MSTPVILAHLDDVGSTQGSVSAWRALRRAGLIRSASVMVPCPWYRAAVDDYQADPDQDLGIHLTLNSEWQQYRWRPLTGPAGGLTDEQGFFHHRPQAVVHHADPKAVEDEFAAQIERTLADGIRPSHLDAHMGTAFLPKFQDALLTVSDRYNIPVPLIRDMSVLTKAVGVSIDARSAFSDLHKEGTQRGWPVFDRFLMGFTPPDQQADTFFANLLSSGAQGTSWFAMHANAQGDMNHIAQHMARPREQEYLLFSDKSAGRVFPQPCHIVNWAEYIALLSTPIQSRNDED